MNDFIINQEVQEVQEIVSLKTIFWKLGHHFTYWCEGELVEVLRSEKKEGDEVHRYSVLRRPYLKLYLKEVQVDLDALIEVSWVMHHKDVLTYHFGELFRKWSRELGIEDVKSHVEVLGNQAFLKIAVNREQFEIQQEYISSSKEIYIEGENIVDGYGVYVYSIDNEMRQEDCE